MKRVVRVRLRSFGFVVSKKTIFTVVLLCLFVIALLVLGMSVLRVRTVTCELQKGLVCDDVLLAESQKIIGTPLYALEFSAYESRMLRAMPHLKTIEFSLLPPAQVKVTGELHEPAFMIKLASGSALFVVSENGVLTREVNDEDQKTLGIPAEFQNGSLPMLGESLDKSLHKSLLNTFDQLKTSSMPVEKILVYGPRQLELLLPEGKVGVIDGISAEPQLNALQQLLNTATIREQGAQRIDVRFARPVLR